MLSYLITVLITIGLIAHVVKTGRNTIWIYLFVFTALQPLLSLICWLAYFVVEIVPEIKQSRMAKRAASGLRKTVDPHRDLRQASQQLAVNDSVGEVLLTVTLLADVRGELNTSTSPDVNPLA